MPNGPKPPGSGGGNQAAGVPSYADDPRSIQKLEAEIAHLQSIINAKLTTGQAASDAVSGL